MSNFRASDLWKMHLRSYKSPGMQKSPENAGFAGMHTPRGCSVRGTGRLDATKTLPKSPKPGFGKKIFWRSQRVTILAFVGRWSLSATQNCCRILKGAIANVQTCKSGCVPISVYTNRQWAAWASGHSYQSLMLRAPLDPGAPETHHATSSHARHLYLPQLHSGIDLCKWAPSAEQVHPAGVGKVTSEGHILSLEVSRYMSQSPQPQGTQFGVEFLHLPPSRIYPYGP